jgi:hypothetical protein
MITCKIYPGIAAAGFVLWLASEYVSMLLFLFLVFCYLLPTPLLTCAFLGNALLACSFSLIC